MTINTKRYPDGDFILVRKGGAKPPFYHHTFAAAEKEAGRLLGLHPGSTIVVLQEVARIKLKGGGPSGAPACPAPHSGGIRLQRVDNAADALAILRSAPVGTHVGIDVSIPDHFGTVCIANPSNDGEVQL